MENTTIDICLCTGGYAQVKDMFSEQLIPISGLYLYLKYSESELASKSDDFSHKTIPNIPISVFISAARNLCVMSDSFKERLLHHSKESAVIRATAYPVSARFIALFENEVKSTLELDLKRDEVSDYITASRILYHIGCIRTRPNEGRFWGTFCCLINPHRTTFELSMRSFLDNDPMTIEDMAKEMKLSLTYFKNKCTEYLGTTPHKWIITQQLHRAYIDVITTDYSVNKIAERAKFDNVSHFIKLFKREFLTTPLQLRYSLRTSVTV